MPHSDHRRLIHARGTLDSPENELSCATWVIDEFDRLCRSRGKPRSIRVDNGPELIGRLLNQLAYLDRVELHFSRPGKPSVDAYIEAFNSQFRQACLDASWLLSMGDAHARIENREVDYNRNRPHSAIGGLTPTELADQ